jgi:signal transduction histidine kinase
VAHPSGEASGDLARVVRALPAPAGGSDRSLLPTTWSVDSPAPGTVVVPMPDPLLRQVLLNLLTNAGVHGAPPVDLTVRLVDAGERPVAVLMVGDAGPGVPAEFLPTAAERFSRTDAARPRPGAGLGLSLVHALVRRYDGELRLCSRGAHHRYEHRFDVGCHHPTVGTTATVLLPALR